MSILDAVLLIAGGLSAGFINTLAGGGGVIAVPILTEMVGVQTANGTYRIAVFLANIGAAITFHRGGKVPWGLIAPLIPAAMLGAGAGAWVATVVDPDFLRRFLAAVLLLVAASVLLGPSRWIEERQSAMSLPLRLGAFAAIGFYGGFVQVGAGFLLLAGLVLGTGLNLVGGNAAKVVLISVYTPVALLFFARAAQVDLGYGAVLSVGQITGAWLGARFAIAKGAEWVRWILLGAAVVAAVRLAFL